MGNSAGFEAEEKHDDSANDGNDADPVDRLDAGNERGARSVQFEEDEEHHEGEAIQREVDIELKILVSKGFRRGLSIATYTPPPRNLFCKDTANNWSHSRCKCPSHAHKTKIFGTFPH